MQHIYIICIGSNYHRKESLCFARESLSALFSTILFGEEQDTEPVSFNNPALFANQLARIETDKELRQVKSLLKKIETDAGRKPKDKDKGKIVLDIDILIYDGQVLKEEDLQRAYISEALKQFA